MSGLVLTGEQDIFGRGDQNDPVLVAMLGNAVHGRPLFFPATCIDGVNMAVRRAALEENGFPKAFSTISKSARALPGRGASVN